MRELTLPAEYALDPPFIEYRIYNIEFRIGGWGSEYAFRQAPPNREIVSFCSRVLARSVVASSDPGKKSPGAAFPSPFCRAGLSLLPYLDRCESE